MKNFINCFFILIVSSGVLFSQTININKEDVTPESYNLSDIQNITFIIGDIGSVTDVDGNTYETVKIGNQLWMVENLKVTHYRNGDPIPNITSPTEWANLTTGAYCNYDNNENNVTTYGRLYNWHAVNDSRNIAPEGWHVPTDEEWKELEMYLGMSQSEADKIHFRGTNEGGKLKEAGTSHWYSPNTGANNQSGFTALPGGCRHTTAAENYSSFRCDAYFWTATEHDGQYPYYCNLRYTNSSIRRTYSYKPHGFSVRCVIKITVPKIIFDYKKYLFGDPVTLNVWIDSINTSTGYVILNGYDSQIPNIPFTWDWGDGNILDGFFPQEHTYSNISENYVVKITAHYSESNTDSLVLLVRFVSPSIDPISLPNDLKVTIPSEMPHLTTRLYPINPNLTTFNNSFFDAVPRSTVEYVLTVVAVNQMEYVNQDVFAIDGNFKQVVLRDDTFRGMYSIWYSNPVAFGTGDYGFQGSIEYSSFFHEMGHNFTLNTPADYYYGGKIDGYANAIFSETMAQIFQHATGYEIINNFLDYGLSEDIMMEIKQSMISSIKRVRNAYEEYINTGKNFVSWNDPSTPKQDETENTFMTIAYQFFVHAENSNLGYRSSLKRMMEFLQNFNEDWQQRYDPLHNTVKADTFRATLMVTAVSYAFNEDLRDEFRYLKFPISDDIYNELMYNATNAEKRNFLIPEEFHLSQNYPNPFNSTTKITYTLPQTCHVLLQIFNIQGELVKELVNVQKQSGNYI